MNDIDKNQVDLDLKESFEVVKQKDLAEDVLSNQGNRFNQSVDHNQESKYGIKWDQIPTSSIESFYKHIQNSVKYIAADFFENLIENNRVSNDVAESSHELIKEINNHLTTEFQSRNIKKIKRTMFWLKIAFWTKKYKEAKSSLHEWKVYEQLKKGEIRNNKQTIKRELNKILNNVKVKDLIHFILDQLGLKSKFDLPQDIKKWLIKSNSSYIDVTSVIQGKLKNNPFYDLTFRELIYIPVITSATEDFSYSYKDSEGKISTRYETLYAEHYEDTPYINTFNTFIVKTNYDPNLIFKICRDKFWSKSSKIYQIIENDEFKNNFSLRVKNTENAEQKILQLFSLLAQENFVKWIHQNPSMMPLEKNKDGYFLTKSQDRNKLNVLSILEQPLIKYCQNRPEETVNQVKEKIIKLAIAYFKEFAKNAQLPLLLPAFSREYYQENNQYLIANQSAIEDEFKDEKSFGLHQIINRYLHKSFYWFNNLNERLSKPTFFKPISVNQIQPNLYNGLFNLSSYYGIKRVDNVSVVGKFVGPKIISVPYVEHIEVNEEKQILYLRKLNPKLNYHLMINDSAKLDHFPDSYNQSSIHEIFKTFKIYCSNPKAFENNPDFDQTIEILKRYYEIIKETSKSEQFSLSIDCNGIVINVNDPKLMQPELESKLINDILLKLINLDLY